MGRALALFGVCLAATPVFGSYPTEATARSLPVDDAAWAGSSANVVAGNRQPLFTDGVHQFAAYFDSEGQLVLARRRLGSDAWATHSTGHRVDLRDAHRTASLGVDGQGYLHVAWGHHNSPLHYARSRWPHDLDLGRPEPMLGRSESRVTYPQFVRLPSGELIFAYRDGGSGNGALVLNAYDPAARVWERLHDALLDGEGQRSAYWDLTADARGGLHLAWNWRETPDVASNHDLAYAYSPDGGRTWRRADGGVYAPPIKADAADYAVRIPENRNLMNPPTVGADRRGNPYLVSYWSAENGSAPRFHVVFRRDDAWHVVDGPQAREPFTLAGHGTKRPPWSRAALLVESDWRNTWVHLLYRDDAQGGRLVAATLTDPGGEAEWAQRILVDENLGAWEPTIDPLQWLRMRQGHLLLQSVAQLDGDDANAADQEPTAIATLVWNPEWSRSVEQGGEVRQRDELSPPAADPISPKHIRDTARRVLEWQWEHRPDGPGYRPREWTMAPLYIGMLAVDPILPEARIADRLVDFFDSEAVRWGVRDRVYHADDHCVMQPYLELYQRLGEQRMIEATRERLDTILEHPSGESMNYVEGGVHDRWVWCDALFMAPMSWLLMWEVSGDETYLDFMNREWWATTERLYFQAEGLYFRDESYLDLREPNGRTIHWSRGNGWVISGLARVLEHFPADHPDAPRYEQLFRDMCAAMLRAQQSDGLWRPGLLDPEAHPARETSGSSFITHALAWGLHTGRLDREETLPAVRRAWRALETCITPEGKLEHAQPIGAAPEGFDPAHSEPFATGAFLLAAAAVHELEQQLSSSNPSEPQ